MLLFALKKSYEADEAEHTAVIDTFLQKSIGVADHDNFMDTLKDRFNALTHTKCCLISIKDIEEKAVISAKKDTEKK